VECMAPTLLVVAVVAVAVVVVGLLTVVAVVECLVECLVASTPVDTQGIVVVVKEWSWRVWLRPHQQPVVWTQSK